MKIGILGGSGLYDIDGLKNVRRRLLKTPFGEPSDAFVLGSLGAHEVFFLPRHGRGHRLLPSEINHRANIYGLKYLGVERVLSFGAVGSLRETIRPRDVVLPDQYFDRTKPTQEHTFFGGGIVAHVAFGDPACADLRAHVAHATRRVLAARPRLHRPRLHVGGTYVTMEGPAFSTRAEAEVYRSFGFSVVGMTSLPEAKLCREAEMCYQAVALVTDYDCWHATEQEVSVEMLLANLLANTALARDLIREIVLTLPERRPCGCKDALKTAILTPTKSIPQAVRHKLAPIIGRYVPSRRGP